MSNMYKNDVRAFVLNWFDSRESLIGDAFVLLTGLALLDKGYVIELSLPEDPDTEGVPVSAMQFNPKTKDYEGFDDQLFIGIPVEGYMSDLFDYDYWSVEIEDILNDVVANKMLEIARDRVPNFLTKIVYKVEGGKVFLFATGEWVDYKFYLNMYNENQGTHD